MAEKAPKYSDPTSSGQIQSMSVDENALIAIWPDGASDALESSGSLKEALDALRVQIPNDAQGFFQRLERVIERLQRERQESEKFSKQTRALLQTLRLKVQQDQEKREAEDSLMQRIQERLLLSDQVREGMAQQLQELRRQLRAQQP